MEDKAFCNQHFNIQTVDSHRTTLQTNIDTILRRLQQTFNNQQQSELKQYVTVSITNLVDRFNTLNRLFKCLYNLYTVTQINTTNQNQQIQHLRQQLQECSRQLRECQVYNNKSREYISRLETRNRELETRNRELETRNRTLETRNRTLDNENQLGFQQLREYEEQLIKKDDIIKYANRNIEIKENNLNACKERLKNYKKTY